VDTIPEILSNPFTRRIKPVLPLLLAPYLVEYVGFSNYRLTYHQPTTPAVTTITHHLATVLHLHDRKTRSSRQIAEDTIHSEGLVDTRSFESTSEFNVVVLVLGFNSLEWALERQALFSTPSSHVDLGAAQHSAYCLRSEAVLG